MPTLKRQLGDLGEKIACDYLKKQGYLILEQNYQKPWGEIDIISQKDKKTIVFIEVKTIEKSRGSEMSKKITPETNVHFSKQQKLIRTCQTYLLEKNYPPETAWQIDVIAIELDKQTRLADLRHFKNAVY